MNNILIPTDFSKNSWNAVVYALSFFKDEPSIFHLLHISVKGGTVAENDELHTAGISLRTHNLSNRNEQFDEFLQKINIHYPNNKYQFKTFVKNSFFIEGIREYVIDNDINLIVMGTKGASGLKEMTIGSRTGEVITKVKCPIIVIPEKAHFKIPINIAFPTDFNITYKSRVVETLNDIVMLHNASVKILRVAQNKQPLSEFQQKNRDYLKNVFVNTPHSFHVVENPNLEDALQQFVTTMKIDMIAMIAKNLNFFQRILFRPKVSKISYHMETPFLVLHE